MNDGIIFENRDLVLVNFPFTNLDENKQRPVLILSNKEFNQKGVDIIGCFVTSKIKYNDSIAITITENDMDSGQLHYTSQIIPTRLFTIEKIKIKKKLGRLSEQKSSIAIKMLKEAISTPQTTLTK
ncbi:MAG: type II toxin-antitoxin system PemK/MazF family toxin [Candidatus Woesearchaeota archaeon]